MSSDTTLAAEPPSPGQGASFTYDAFLSYSHDDEAVAAGIQKGLHRIGRRVGQLNALRVFRDTTDLAANPDLWGRVTDAMDRSRYLIVLLSPSAATSEWVDREVGYWLTRRGPDQMLIVLAEGHLDWDEATERFDPDRSDVALPVLKEPGVFPGEPLYVDVSGDAPWDLQAPTFRDKVTDLAAPIHGKSKYELASDDVREQRRFRRLRRVAIISLVVLTVFALAAAAVAVVAAVVATTNQHKAQEQQRVATARQLIAEARLTVDSDPKTALRLSLAARSIHPGGEAEVSVFETLTATRYISTLTGSARKVGFSPDVRTLAIGGNDGTVVLWDVSDPAHPRQLGSSQAGHTGFVTSMTFSPNGRTLAAANGTNTPEDGMVELWDVSDRAHPQRLGEPLTGNTGWVESLVFSPDGHTLATSDSDTLLWDVSDPARPQRLGSPLTGPNGPVYSAVFTRDGHTLATGSGDGAVFLWDVSDRAHPQQLGRPTGHTGFVRSVVFSPDGGTLATSGPEVLLWDVSDPARPQRLGTPLTDPGGGEAMVFTSDGHTLTASSRGRTILWDVSDPARPQRLGEPLINPSGGVESVVLSPDGRTQATGKDNGAVVLWDVADPARPHRLGQPMTGQAGEVASMAYSPQTQTLAIGSGADDTVLLWNVADRDRPQRLGPTLTGHADWVESVALTPDGRTLAVGFAAYRSADESKLLLWDLSDPARPQQLGRPLTGGIGDLVKSIAFSPDGRTLATGGIDDTVLWDVSERANPKQLGRPLDGDAESVAFSPDGNTLAIGLVEAKVLLWDVSDRAHPQRLGEPLTGHTSNAHSVAFSPDGRTLATGSFDRTVLLWDLSDRAHPQRLGIPLTGHTSWVWSVAFSPDGHTLATGSDDGTLLWDVSDRTRPQRLGQPFTGSKSVVFGPDGRTLATTVGGDGGAFVVSYGATTAGAEQPAPDSSGALLWSVEALLDLHAQSVRHACEYAGGGLDREEWARYVPDLPYQDSCSI